MEKSRGDAPSNGERVNAVLARFEGDYFLDYAAFTGTFREYVAGCLETQFNANPNELHRRAYMLALYREEYTAYEDLGAFVAAFLPSQNGNTYLPMTRLLTYAPGSVKLGYVLANAKVVSGDDLFSGLDLDTWIPDGWGDRFPDIDLRRALRRGCFYIVEDCRASQKPDGVAAFNKIKHGLMFVSEARRLKNELPPGPGALFPLASWDERSIANPVGLLAITINDRVFEERRKQVHFVQKTLRLLALLYVIKRYPQALGRLGTVVPLDAFAHAQCGDLLAFARELSNKPWVRGGQVVQE